MVARMGGEAVKFTSSCSFSITTKVKTVCGLGYQRQVYKKGQLGRSR